MMTFKTIVGGAVLVLLTFQSRGWGWGSYGHQQINYQAIELLKGPLATCFARNRDYLVRLAITPDADWKWGGTDGFAMNVYNVAENLPQRPQDPKLLAKLEKILAQGSKTSKKKRTPILSPTLVAGINKNRTDRSLMQQMVDAEKSAGAIGDFSYEELKQKSSIDNVEHSLHFWEADAFTKEPKSSLITQLESGSDYDKDVLEHFEKYLQSNEAYVTRMDPCKKATSDVRHDVITHGTAPWRSYSLLVLGSTALKNAVQTKNAELFGRALMYLGTMGHYVGDMGQPFHATLNFDGQTESATMGIHSSYEEKILERIARRQAKATQDKQNKLWAPFSATNSTANRYATAYMNGKSPAAVDDDKVVPTIYKLVADGYDLIGKLLPAYKTAVLANEKGQMDFPITDCDTKKTKHRSPHAGTLEQFMNTPLEGANLTVLESAEKRMGEASAVLAQLWMTAIKMSQVNESALNYFCPAVSFNRHNVIADYPFPQFHKPEDDFAKHVASYKGAAKAPDESEHETDVDSDSSGQMELDLGGDQKDDPDADTPRDPASKKASTKKKSSKP